MLQCVHFTLLAIKSLNVCATSRTILFYCSFTWTLVDKLKYLLCIFVKDGGEHLWDTNVPLSDIPEADASGASRCGQGGHACLVLHNLLRLRYPTGQQDDFGTDGQHPIVLEGNDIPHEGRNPL